MNWHMAVVFSVIVVVSAVMILTILYYVRHCSTRKLDAFGGVNQPEGQYFKRYMPSGLREQYDNLPGSRWNDDHPAQDGNWLIYTLYTLLVVAGFVILSGSLYRNIDLFLSSIDLDEEDIAALDFKHHQWLRDVDTDLLVLPDELASMQLTGIVIPYAEEDKGWRYNGLSLRAQAIGHWKRFAAIHQLKVMQCSWARFSKCMAMSGQWVGVVVPGYWDLPIIDKSLASGANLILYGPPAQLLGNPDSVEVSLLGLTFNRQLNLDAGAITLLGEQLLTIGFDAGLVVNVDLPFAGYSVKSDQPQAISIGYSYVASGGEDETRLFAKIINEGRVVWFDFPPTVGDNYTEANSRHLDSLVASMFRFFSRREYSALATWPEGRRFAAILEEDSEDKYVYAEAVVELFKAKGYPITWYILSNEALEHRWLTREMAEIGEIACHGDNHAPFTKSSFEQQVERIARCQKVLERITGQKPVGFRPPEEKYNQFTIDAIVNNDMGHFIAATMKDRAVPEIIISKTDGRSLVSIPRLVDDDYEIWHVRKLDHESTLGLLYEQLDWVQNIGGIYMFSFHTQFMGDDERLNTMGSLAERIKEKSSFFSTSSGVEDWWRLRRSLLHGEVFDSRIFEFFKPNLITVTSMGDVIYSPLVMPQRDIGK